MNDTNARRLYTLAHPLILSAAPVVENSKELRLLPFPEINLNWEGFTLSWLHWTGINGAKPLRRGQLIELALNHESFHLRLAHFPFSQYIKHLMVLFYESIFHTFQEELEQIDVPITADQSGNALQKQLHHIDQCMTMSNCIEEVYAVRSSLLKAQKEHLIEDELLQEILARYKGEYDKYILRFAFLYTVFNFVASEIGEDAATGLVFSVSATITPPLAFLDVVSDIGRIAHDVSNNLVWEIPEKQKHFIKSLSVIEACDYFCRYIDYLDPDDSRYGKTRLLKKIEELDQYQKASTSQVIIDDIGKLLHISTPTAYMISNYSVFKDDPFKIDLPEQVDYGNPVIIIEAIRQQLTQGFGIVCPFWDPTHAHRCCGSSSKAFLEKVWKCTKPDRSNILIWGRMGCLSNKFAVTH